MRRKMKYKRLCSLQLLLVAPLSLYVRLIQNWVMGELGCFILPVIQVGGHNSINTSTNGTFQLFQDLPSHISVLSMFVANLIRYGNLLFPVSSRPTTSFLLPLCWVGGIMMVLPYLPNIKHYYLHVSG